MHPISVVKKFQKPTESFHGEDHSYNRHIFDFVVERKDI
jgi:hypothetical protein